VLISTRVLIAAAILPACAPLPPAESPATAADLIDAELFRVVMERDQAMKALPQRPKRADPRPLPGSPAYWYMRGPEFAEGVAHGVIDERRSILAEIGIAETDIERDSRCPANPFAESYEACPVEHSYVALALSLAWSGAEDQYEPCAPGARCVMRMLDLRISPRGIAIAVWDYFFSWDAAAGRWVIDDIVNLWVT
jgi:hypothetical protein